ncbi:MAG: hypothetical protein ABJG68_05455 [Crocinitomicaceae bacterium]
MKTSISTKNLLIGWAIKLVFAAIFILIHTYYYSDGILYGDVANFIQDSRVISEFAQKEPWEFTQLFFGYNSNDLILHQTHLADTNIWSYGDNGDFINDNRLIIRINTLIHLIAFGNIWVHVLIFAFISYVGVLLLYKTFKDLTNRPYFLYYTLLIFPTISFWGGGITKETLLVFSIGIFFWAIKKIRKNEHLFSSFSLLCLGIILLLFNKPHVGLFIIPLTSILIIIDRFGFSRKTLLTLGLSLVAGFTVLCFTPSKVNLVERISYKQKDLMNLGTGGIFFITDSSFCAFDHELLENFDYKKSEGLIVVNEDSKGKYKLFGSDYFYPFEMRASSKQYEVYHVIAPSKSIVSVPPINNSPLQLLKNTPTSLLNVLVRPFPSDGGSSLKHLLFIENILFLFFVIVLLKNRIKLNKKKASWFYYLLFSGVSLVLIIGWTTPILGAIARYKMAPLLLIVIALCLILPPKKTIDEIPV